MSLFEWLGESHNPGSQGSLSFEKPGRRRPTGNVLARFVLAVTLVAAAGFFLVAISPSIVDHAAVAAGIFAAYLVLSYFARPEPDTSNVGLLGGLIDHPFRYSDDINRFLWFLKVVLFPGRFIAEAIVDIFRLLRSS